MKKRFIYICMFASLLTFSSCNEALDVAPDGRLSLDEVFQDPDLTKAYFSTCFDSVSYTHLTLPTNSLV